MSVPIAVDAPAKLNLWLTVTRRRDDGFHELSSIIVLLDLADRLLLMPGCAGLRVEARPGSSAPPARDENLAWRGLVAGMGGEPELACLTLEKRIPVAAGLGGGSSDAAAAWRLGRRWVGASETAAAGEMTALARIGADVPFFAARAAAALVEGIGERVSPLQAPAPLEVLLVHPPFELSTAAVFAELRPEERSSSSPPPPRDLLEPGPNDLLAAARRLRPELDDAWRLVVAAGAEPHLTGSGPTLFALPGDPERAEAMAARLARGGLRVTRTRTRARAASIETIAEEDP